MSDWSKYAAQRIKQKTENEQLRNARALQEENLLNLNAPREWGDLRDLLMQMSSDFNAEPEMHGILAWDNSDPNALKIEHTRSKVSVRLTFDPDHHEIKVGGLAGSGKTYKAVVIEGARETCFMSGSLTAAPREIAREVLDGLLGIGK